jgi:ketosteroid isomerase-like protein
VSSDNVGLTRRIARLARLDDFGAAFQDEESVQAVRSALAPFLDREFEFEMLGPEYAQGGASGHGVEEYLAAWREWLGPWESYRIEAEEYLDAGDKVVMLVRQLGTTKMGGAPIENRGAAVFSFSAGKLTRIEFHLDRERAMKAAGLDR